jgi:hypothetical protein
MLVKNKMLSVNQTNAQIKLTEMWKMENVEEYPVKGERQTAPENGRETIMWYFEEEADAKMFDDQGMRKRRITPSTIDYTDTPSAMQQRIRDFTYAERAASRKTAFVKPYIVGVDRMGASYADASRVVGTACSNAGGYERVDIKLSRMSH